jgi:hypothetical protein
MTGTIFVETMFRVNGIGKFFVTSITSRDYPMVLALMLIIASLWGLVYLLTDLISTVIDPRIKLDSGNNHDNNTYCCSCRNGCPTQARKFVAGCRDPV